MRIVTDLANAEIENTAVKQRMNVFMDFIYRIAIRAVNQNVR
jgi:hypothetical protein